VQGDVHYLGPVQSFLTDLLDHSEIDFFLCRDMDWKDQKKRSQKGDGFVHDGLVCMKVWNYPNRKQLTVDKQRFLFNDQIKLIEKTQDTLSGMSGFPEFVLVGVNDVMIGGRQIRFFKIGIFKNSVQKITIGEGWAAKIGIGKINLFQGWMKKLNWLYLGSVEGRIIQNAMVKGNGQSIFIASVKKNTDHLTSFESDIPENNLMGFDQTQITVYEFAINENSIGDIDAIKITMDETAIFILPCFECIYLKINVLKLFIFY
jgi:hypothetical protein